VLARAVAAAEDEPCMSTRTILVVNAGAATLALIRAALAPDGYAVLDAAGDQPVLDAMRAHRPDLVLQDLGHRGEDGVALLPQLRALPGGSALSVVALLGSLSEWAPDEIARADFTDYLVKPLEPSRLRQTVRIYLAPLQQQAEHLFAAAPLSPSS
jgi:CheY-like chemotaxis protein